MNYRFLSNLRNQHEMPHTNHLLCSTGLQQQTLLIRGLWHRLARWAQFSAMIHRHMAMGSHLAAFQWRAPVAQRRTRPPRRSWKLLSYRYHKLFGLVTRVHCRRRQKKHKSDMGAVQPAQLFGRTKSKINSFANLCSHREHGLWLAMLRGDWWNSYSTNHQCRWFLQSLGQENPGGWFQSSQISNQIIFQMTVKFAGFPKFSRC